MRQWQSAEAIAGCCRSISGDAANVLALPNEKMHVSFFRFQIWRTMILRYLMLASCTLPLLLGMGFAQDQQAASPSQVLPPGVSKSGGLPKGIARGSGVPYPPEYYLKQSEVDGSPSKAALSTYLEEVNICATEYERNVRSSGFHLLLDFTRIASDPELKNSRTQLSHQRKILQQTEQKIKKLIDDYLRSRAQISGIESARENNEVKSEFDSIWTQGYAMLDAIEKIQNHLHSTRANWILKNNGILFANRADKDRYEILTGELERLIAAQKIKKSIKETNSDRH